MHFIVVSALGRHFTRYNVQWVLEMEWHNLYCMLLNHQRSVFFSTFFVTFHLAAPSSLFIISPIYVFEQLLMQLLSVTQVINVHLMLLLLCREIGKDKVL